MDINCIFIYLLCMFKLKIFKLKTKLAYATSPWAKIPYLILSIILIWGLFSGEGPFSIFGLIIFLVCLAGLLYVELWTFDNNTRKVTSYFGIFPIVRRKTYDYDSIEALQITHFTRGVLPQKEAEYQAEAENHAQDNKKRKRGTKPMTVFELALQDDPKTVAIEIIEESKSGGRTEADATKIALYTQLHLKIDRPQQKGPTLKISDLPRGFNKR